MKILMVTDKMDIGGAETHILTLIRELTKNGERVTLLSAGGLYADELRKRGIRTVYSPFDKRDPISVLKCKRTLAKEMRGCDIIHTHTRFSSYLASRVRAQRSFPPIVTTAHLNFKMFPFGKLSFWGDKTLAVSEDIKKYLCSNYTLDESCIKLTKNSIDTSLFKNERIEKKLIIHTSRIDKGRSKTAFMLCDCALSLLQKHEGWRILIVGDGECFASLKRRAEVTNAHLGYEGVILIGARYDIPSILRYGAIFVGVSRSALEGMAAGLPVIICGDEGYGGILSNENFSLLFKSNFCARGLEQATGTMLSQDIETLIYNAELRRNLSLFSKNAIKEFFSPEEMANDAMECYNLTRRRPSVCLFGYFGYDNLGDEMTLREAIFALLYHGISDISLLASAVNEPLKEARYKSFYKNIKTYNRMSPGEIRCAIENADVLLLCGGNLLQNETSERSLIYYSLILKYAHKHGCRIYILSSGFGSIKGAHGNFLLGRSLRLSDYCGCRTNYDLEVAKKCASYPKFMPDFCFLLKESYPNANKSYFCWIVSKKALIHADEILEISRKRKIAPLAVFLNFPEDKSICKHLAEHNISYSVPKNFESFASIAAKAEFTVNERLHGAIFSIICHVPAYLFTDSPKKAALISDCNKICDGVPLLLNYNKNDVLAKKEIGAKDSDFSYLIDRQRCEIHRELCELFD